MTGEEASKRMYHEKYFHQTHAVLQKHVHYLVNELDELSESSNWRKKDMDRHPRLPLLTKHNEYVRTILDLVQENLDAMSTS